MASPFTLILTSLGGSTPEECIIHAIRIAKHLQVNVTFTHTGYCHSGASVEHTCYQNDNYESSLTIYKNAARRVSARQSSVAAKLHYPTPPTITPPNQPTLSVGKEEPTNDDATDAARYRWLRKQFWDNSSLCVVANPKNSVKLGQDCPSLDRLDKEIDIAMEHERQLPPAAKNVHEVNRLMNELSKALDNLSGDQEAHIIETSATYSKMMTKLGFMNHRYTNVRHKYTDPKNGVEAFTFRPSVINKAEILLAELTEMMGGMTEKEHNFMTTASYPYVQFAKACVIKPPTA